MAEPLEIDDETFEDWVFDALDELPERIREGIGSLGVLIEDAPPPELTERYGADLYGHYTGEHLSVADRYSHFRLGPPPPPSTITIYRRACLADASTVEAVHARVRVTVFHEVGHQLGISDERLHTLLEDHGH
jgi:predicted Zn-dependent protease with MMP-like domain